MSETRTAELTLTFEISRQDDDGWPWVVILQSVTPRGTGLGGSAATYDHPLALALVHPIQAHPPQKECACCHAPGVADAPPGTRICDACAVEESIQNLGCEDWLATTDPPHIFDPPVEAIHLDGAPLNRALTIDREGTIQVRGHMAWHYYSGVDGEDWDEEFNVAASSYLPAAEEK